MTDYKVRIGTSRRTRPVGTYEALLRLPSRLAEDDGLIAGPWITVADSAWPWNEGPCPCGRGVMRWAEAGYVAWHRICDVCGSHWEMHPVTIHVSPGPDAEVGSAAAMERAKAQYAAEVEAAKRLLPEDTRRRLAEGWEEDQLHELGEDGRPVGVWADYYAATGAAARRCREAIASGRPNPLDRLVRTDPDDSPEAAEWRARVIALIRPEHVTPEVIRHGAIHGGWARRARFYS